jgi:hypothetical protein
MAQEVILLRKVLNNLDFPQIAPIPVFAAMRHASLGLKDLLAAVTVPSTLIFVCSLCFICGQQVIFQLLKIESLLNGADILTKIPTSSDVLADLRRGFMIYLY